MNNVLTELLYDEMLEPLHMMKALRDEGKLYNKMDVSKKTVLIEKIYEDVSDKYRVLRKKALDKKIDDNIY